MAYTMIEVPRRTLALVVEATDHWLLCHSWRVTPLPPHEADRAGEMAVLHATLQAMVEACPLAETFACDFALAQQCHGVLKERLTDLIPASLERDLLDAEAPLYAALEEASHEQVGVTPLQACLTAVAVLTVLLALFALAGQ